MKKYMVKEVKGKWSVFYMIKNAIKDIHVPGVPWFSYQREAELYMRDLQHSEVILVRN